MNNYTREYTFIVPPASTVNYSYTTALNATRDLISSIADLIKQLELQRKINSADLVTDWCEVVLDNLTSEYRVSLFSTARAVKPEIIKAIHDLAIECGFTVLIRTVDMQDVFSSGKPEFIAYFASIYMSTGTNFTAAHVGAKVAYARQNCRPLVANEVVDREVDLSAPETKTTVLRDLGIRNKLYQLKSVTISGGTVSCKLSGPRGEIIHTVPVDREVWSKWPIY